ncbi:zinc transporter ZIP9 [Strongylocentrotus purpuratus]|uniref:Solute carrier family 39 member 9 n=1 Tax=Strongylocentrotus purpuratus TaxID=7668 RepID=A0A7M7TH54_STRPU|nr:zinc transporter ZIP9 [Strongylocentrotus purpuratus]
MMDEDKGETESWGIILLSLAMLIGCYIAGSVPLSITMSENKTRLTTVIGAGLLVGTSLAVIIPEGIHSLFADAAPHNHEDEARAVLVGPENKLEVGQETNQEADDHAHHHAHSSVEDLHSLVGIALVFGFVFMLLVDQIGGGHGHSHAQIPGEQEATGRIGRGKSITATLGLVVHAAADGVAMGAAASGSRADVQMIVFVAIMLHKAPAAFGLVTFLLHENYERNRIRKHLVIFSLAAPVMAIFTYFSLSHASKEALLSVNATGLSMLFSAGTFLYVATVHVLPEIQAPRQSSAPATDPEGAVDIRQGFTCGELAALVIGCLAPLVLAMGHHH